MNKGVDIVCQHNVNTHKWNSEDLQRNAEFLGIIYQSTYLFLLLYSDTLCSPPFLLTVDFFRFHRLYRSIC